MAEDLVTIVVNGTTIAAHRGQNLLDVLTGLGVEVPTLCFDNRLPPHGGCRVCLVARRDRGGGLITACSTTVEREMIIDTAGPDVIAARRRQLQLLVSEHRMECPACEESGVCRLQRYLFEYGVDDTLGSAPPRPRHRRLLAPVLRHDRAKCIVCGRCVRVCQEVLGVGALGIVGRGADAHIDGFGGLASGCEFCGACIEACPVGALTGDEDGLVAPHWMREVENSTCPLCSLACRIRVEKSDGRTCAVRPIADDDGPGLLCARGWLGHDAVEAETRYTVPLVREKDEWSETGWDDALRLVVNAVKEARANGKAVVGVTSTRLLNEDSYLFQRLLRSAIKTPHVLLSPTRTAEAVKVLESSLGSPPALAGERELDVADVVLVAGEDPALTHPVARSALLAAVRRGARVVYLPWRTGPVGRRAAVRPAPAPGSQADVVTWIADQCRSEDESLDGARASAEKAAKASGSRAEDLLAAASELAGARRPLVVLSLSRGGAEDPTALTHALLFLLARLSPTSQVGRQFLLLGDGVNTIGALAMGVDPERLPGWRSVGDDDDVKACSRVWGQELPSEHGYDWEDLRQALTRDEVGVLYLVGADPTLAPAHALAPELLQRADFVVAQAGHPTLTTRLADVVLPAAVLHERHGHLLRFDGGLARLQRTKTPPDAVRQDGDVFAELGRLLGVSLPMGRALRDELATLGPKTARAPGRVAPVERPEPEPLSTGLRLYWGPVPGHDGWTTAASRRLSEVWPGSVIWLSPEDCMDLEAEVGEPIVVELEGTSRLLQLRVDPDLRSGCAVSNPFGFMLASGGWCTIPASGRPITVRPVRRSRHRERGEDRRSGVSNLAS